MLSLPHASESLLCSCHSTWLMNSALARSKSRGSAGSASQSTTAFCQEFIWLLPMLFVVRDDLGEVVYQHIIVKGQVKLILDCQLNKNPGLIFYCDVKNRLEPVRCF